MSTNSKITLLSCLLLASLFFSSCEKDLGESPFTLPNVQHRTLIIGNEGSFGTNTASVSSIDLDEYTVSNKVFENINGNALGDVLQSVAFINGHYYFVVNNSHKIIITDSNFTQTGEITNVISPRFIKQVASNRAYVTSIYESKIYVIDLASNTKISDIKMDYDWTEQLIVRGDATGDYAYVCEKDTAVNYITKIQVATNLIVDRIPVAGYSPSQISISSDGHIWVLGGNYFDRQGTLTELDPATNTIVQSFRFSKKYTTGQLAIGPNDAKYVTVVDYNTNEHGVYKFDKGATVFPNQFFINSSANAYYYGITVDPRTADVYISDTKGFTQSGVVSRYSSQGVLLNSWTCGLGPSSFYFAD